MKKTLCTGLLLIASGLAAAADDTAGSTAAAKTTAASAETGTGTSAGSAGRTDVIGSQEAPTVFNVVPWKDKPSRLPKKEVTTSILRETLQPLDPEILRREIELQKRLGEP